MRPDLSILRINRKAPAIRLGFLSVPGTLAEHGRISIKFDTNHVGIEFKFMFNFILIFLRKN